MKLITSQAISYFEKLNLNELSKNIEKPNDMKKIRQTLSNLTDEDIEKATKILRKEK